MRDVISLPGLTHLIEVLKSHGIEIQTTPPASRGEADQRILGSPLDPMLASVYARFNDATLGELDLRPLDKVESFGQFRRRDALDEREHKLILYAMVLGYFWYFATVPSLAERGGTQPVVFVDDYDELPIYPIASNVDRAFVLYARYCDRQLSAGGSLKHPASGEDVFHPLGLVEDIARDRPLVAMLEAGRFDDLILPDAEDREWVQSILRASHAQR
jgi:hypothetical protein